MRIPLVICLSLGCLFPASSQAQPAPPPAQAFFADPLMSGAEISPDGRNILVRSSAATGRLTLAAFNLETRKFTTLAGFTNANIAAFFWLNERRVVYTALNLEPSNEDAAAGLFAIDIDGKDRRGLSPAIIRQRSFAELDASSNAPAAGGGGFLPAGADIMRVKIVSELEPGIRFLDTRSGRLTRPSTPREAVKVLSDAQGTPRIAVTGEGSASRLHYKDGKGRWSKSQPAEGTSASDIEPLLYAGDTLYVTSREGGDRRALYRYDPAQGKVLGAPLIVSPEYDIVGDVVTDDTKMLGFRLTIDAPSTVWFDPALKALQAEIDALLPATYNRVARGVRSQTPYVLVSAHAPDHPPVYMFYETQTKKLTRLGKSLPAIDPQRMAQTELLRYKARDGLEVPTYVTVPHGPVKKQLPTIILVNQLPWERNVLEWQPEVQFLVSRGYAVIQADTRGASGYGARHRQAGDRQWGMAMQDDLADAAKWAIAEGIADPRRICIAGTLYGGYAALMGVIRDPELFRCAISWSGIADIGLMFEREWRDFQSVPDSTMLRQRIGDPRADKDRFKAVSPLAQAAHIQRPVLLAYGVQDQKVPFEHGERLYQAIKPHNPLAEFVKYDERGQPRSLANNRIDLWTRIEEFLGRHIGPNPGPGRASDAAP